MLKLLHELKGYQTNLGYSIGQILGYINLSPISQLDDGETEGVWEKLLQILIDEPDFEWLMIDTSHIKEHPHAVGARVTIRTWPALNTMQAWYFIHDSPLRERLTIFEHTNEAVTIK